MLFDHEPLFQFLHASGHGDWADTLRRQVAQALAKDAHGRLAEWKAAWEQLPAFPNGSWQDKDGLEFTAEDGPPAETFREQLMAFHPWRKGPIQLPSAFIDTEWRSDWKWDRLADSVEFRNRTVLDVGCGNGYFGWRMLAKGARQVVGLDPFLLFVMQHEVLKRFSPSAPIYVLPLTDECLPPKLHAFDVALSMGVLYHRQSPFEHLQALREAVCPGGTVVLETLVVDGDEQTVFVPPGRYAQMRNVWCLPSVKALTAWLKRLRFEEIRVVDVSTTTTDEQRSTDWMTFQSLPDFLDPNDSTRTIEGHPAPVRAMIVCQTRT